MSDRPTLEEQIEQEEVVNKIIYAEKVMRAIETMDKEKILELDNAPRSVINDAKRLFAKIIERSDKNRHISEKYVLKPENISAFMYLNIVLDLIEVQERRYFFGIFKRNLVVPKEKA